MIFVLVLQFHDENLPLWNSNSCRLPCCTHIIIHLLPLSSFLQIAYNQIAHHTWDTPSLFYGQLPSVLLWKQVTPSKKRSGPVKGLHIFKYFKFIDDLCTVNNDEFENNYNDDYHAELELKKGNEDPCKALFWSS